MSLEMTHRQTQRDRQTHRERDRHTEGQTQRQTDTQTNGQTQREGQTLFSNLKLLAAAAYNGLQHLVWTNMSLEMTRVPQLAYQLSEPLHENEHLITGSSLDV